MNIREWKRASHVAGVLLGNGLGFAVHELGLKMHLPFTKKIMTGRGEPPKDIPARLRKSFEELGGAFVKLGQFLSLRPDLIPKEYCDEFVKLLDNIRPIPFEQVKKIIELELGRPVTAVFASLDKEPVGSASVAQVHYARLKSGKKVVVKVQRPEAKEQFAADIDLLHYIARKMHARLKDRTVDPVAVVNEFEDYTKRELNFIFEAKNIERFYALFGKSVVIPAVFWPYCTEKVLVIERLDGVKLSELHGNVVVLDKRKTAVRVFDAAMKMFFEGNIFHADLHPGNILAMSNGRIGLLDFGIVGVYDDELKERALKLWNALVNHDTRAVVRILAEYGVSSRETDFQKFESEVRQVLSDWYRGDIKERVTSVLHRLYDVCTLNGIKIPKDMILMAKALLTVEGTCLYLNPAFDFEAESKRRLPQLLKRLIAGKLTASNIAAKTHMFAEAAYRVPETAVEVLESMKSGIRANISLEDTDIRHIGMDISKSSNRLSYSIIIGAVIVAAAMLVDVGPLIRGYSIVSVVLVGIAALLTLSFAVSIVNEGRGLDVHRR